MAPKWQKDHSVTVLVGLALAVHSGTRSHYCLPRRLLAAGFHPSLGLSLLSQPECLGLLHDTHIDGQLSADAPSTWPSPAHRTPALKSVRNPTHE
uniref:Putative secreted protein n=1 Tax=Anopheles marajoara TaxID=58244 RepID=A0A2M4C9D5_9DIPT